MRFFLYLQKILHMTLICDCGSTKAEWAFLDGKNVVKRFITNGFNPNFTDGEVIKNILLETKNAVDNQQVDKICFYGSGCGSEANQNKVAMLFAMVFKINDIEVHPDTLGACHALFGKNPGVACILGTGSNACVFDGEKITKSVASLGFMIGDEGSGCHIGKRIVHDYFLGLMPDDLRAKFYEKYHLDRDKFLKKVYQGEQPSKFLADFTRFASENIENQYIKNIVGGCFEEFIKCSLMAPANDSVGFVGSVAFVFQEILLQVLENHNIKCEKILKDPMDGLVEFYKN